jgi:hypothetical protein
MKRAPVVPCLVDPSLNCHPLKGYAYYRWVSSTGHIYYHAHSAMLAQALGRDILPWHVAAHRCNNPACFRVHPNHVYEATQSENERDKYRHPPHAIYPVEFTRLPRLPRGKYADQVPTIRRLHAAGWNAREIAEHLRMNASTVRSIANGGMYGGSEHGR